MQGLLSSTPIFVAVLAIVISLVLSFGSGFYFTEEHDGTAGTTSAWSNREPPLPPNDSNNHNNDPPFTSIIFRGGRDGTTNLVGRLHPPSTNHHKNAPHPVIVLAHGLGLAQSCSLQPYVDAFSKAGYAALTFDYATFGRSSRLPRHVVDPKTHIADLKAAIAALHDQAAARNVDPDRIGLWGTSFGGGHVLSAVATSSSEEGHVHIRAAAIQVPALASGLESAAESTMGNPGVYLPALVKTLGGVLKGLLLAPTGSAAWYLPLHGPPGSCAVMQNPGDDEGYGSLCPRGGLWRNAVTSTSVLRMLPYRPLSVLSSGRTEEENVLPPMLVLAAELDTLCPFRYAERAVERMERAELVRIDGAGHFDVYEGDVLEFTLRKEIEFFEKHL